MLLVPYFVLRSKNGNYAAASVIEEVVKNPSKVSEIQQAWNLYLTKRKQVIRYTPDEALYLKLDEILAVAQYQHIRNGALKRNIDLYSSYRERYFRSAK